MKDLTQGNIYKTFLLFAIPVVLANLLSESYALIDTVIAGKYLGEDGLAAIGATAALISFAGCLFWGYNAGYGIYVAQKFGAKRYEELRNATCTQAIFVSALTLAAGILCTLLYRPIFSLLKVDEDIIPEAFKYFAVIMLGRVVTIMQNFCVNVLHSCGVSGFTLYMSLLSAVCNIGGNILAIVVLDMGVLGVALSTIASSAIVCLVYFIRLLRVFREMGLKGKPVRPSFQYIRDGLSFCMPVSFQQGAMYFAGLAISPIVNGIGSAATAAYVVVQRFSSVTATIYQGSSKVLGAYTAQCVGSQRFDGIRRGVRVGLLQSVCFLVPVLVVCVVLAEPITALFFEEGYVGESYTLAVDFARIYLPFCFFNVLNNLFHNLYRGVKNMKYLFISTSIGAVTRIVASYVFATFLHMGMQGFYIGMVVAWIVEVIFCGVTYFSGRWMPGAIRTPAGLR